MKRPLLVVVLCLTGAFLLSSCTMAPRRDPVSRPWAVLGAFHQEVALLQGMLTEAKRQEIEGIEFITGRIGDTPVVLAWTGVGKVNAAMTTTLLLEHFRPTRVIFIGIAGGVDPNLEPGDIVIAKQTAYHDMGTLSAGGIDYGGVKSRMTGEPNPVFFPADPGLLEAAQRAAQKTAFDLVKQQTGQRRVKVVAGTVVTGDVFVASKKKGVELAQELGASAVEMEGAAVAQLCYQRGVGCLVLRSISDKADQSAIMDKQLFYAMAAKNSASLVVKIIQAVTRGPNVE
ncbi:MAG: 5'-methylthioadenosine/adenosylhomocysteine nucleosidase [Phycisphaerae bacterium]|nr:5'-methylthioadenosine/adenosylhomocysteine nucleosidase [Phycisphaerae bacterium]